MKEVSELLQKLSESATLAMARMSRELKEKGHDVISLSLGEPDFNTPDFIKEAGKQAIDDNYSHYPPVNGYAELREAISSKFKRDNQLDYSPGQIVVSTGAKQSIANTVLALVNPGDEVILPAPYWVSYIEIVKLAGGIPVVIPTSVEDEYKISPEQLKDHLSPKSRLLIYSSPCNPSGSVYSKIELEALAEVIKSQDNLLVISDEIYELINFGEQHASMGLIEGMYERTITVNGVSKGFAMTGWRIGYLGAPEWIAKACSKIQGQFTSAPSGISQMASKAAVEAAPSVTHTMRDAFLKRRNFMLQEIEQIDGVKCSTPGGAFYLFPDVSAYFGRSVDGQKIKDANDLCMYLLESEYLALVSGDAFGSPNCLRISYAASEAELKEAVARFKNGLAKLRD